jgi:hypothetical protein
MELTETQKKIAANAWALASEGKGQVLEDWAIPEAHELAEAGWLERRIEPNGDRSWWWTSAGETALGLSGVLGSAEGRQN